MDQQSNALTRIATSALGVTFGKARIVYTAVVRPALLYRGPIWFSPDGTEATKPSLLRPLEVIQNRCLWAISGAYRATPTHLLESEIGVLSVRDHLSMLQAQYQRRRLDIPVAGLAATACERIQRQLQGGRGRQRRHPITPGTQKHTWYQRILCSNPQEQNTAPQNQIKKAIHSQ